MAQTLTRILIHTIFSTKNRQPLIPPEIEPELYPYIVTIGRNLGSPVLAIGGTSDHLHLLLSLSKTEALADVVMHIKKDSSLWIKTKGAQFDGFHWQDGYAGLSIGQSQLEIIRRYLARQKEHHRKTTFQDELLTFLKKYNVEYDERYLWT